MRKAVVIGAGKSGQSAAALLAKLGFEVVIADRKEGHLRDDLALPLEGVSLLVLSPGVPLVHPLVGRARQLGIEVIGEIELGLRFLPLKQRRVAVTGSNGKTTTVLLTTHALNLAGKRAVALGNVGVPLCSYAMHPDPEEILVIELSSFQLETLSTHPYFDVAAILNITPNHLDRHASMQEYADCKLKLQWCLKEQGKFLFSEQVAREYLQKSDLGFRQGVGLEVEGGLRRGSPESCNVAAAWAIVQEFGVEEKSFREAVAQFRKPSHRIEWVAEIDQVAYYNDSKASNVEAVIHAVSLFERPIVLIAGGVDKGAPYAPWIEAFGKKVKAMVLFGSSAAKMEEELSGAFPTVRVTDLQEAVQKAASLAAQGDLVLLSPGCSSYDQFANFEKRGEAFRKIVEEKWNERR